MRRQLKALTVKQPWAGLIADGTKTIEVRSWGTRHRGDVLITASASPRIEPFGCALAVVELVAIHLLEPAHLPAACLEKMPAQRNLLAWEFANVRRLVDPIPIRGSMGLWDAALTTTIRRG